MTAILEFLVAHLAFLYAPGRYRFVDSLSGEGFGDAYVVLESDAMRLRMIRDRGQLFMDFEPLDGDDDEDWFAIDVVRRLLTGERQETSELSPDYAAFLERELDEIERRFSAAERDETVRALKELERVRAKEQFAL
jgi:hypothetical protein